jgi:1-acyl-sn-glycerol-3-phosphate acyltransferase
MRKWLSELILFKIWGWKLVKTYPNEVKQSIVPVMPHTSNWDFPIGILLRPIMHTNIRFVAKNSLFIFPFSIFFKSLGGFPVDRSKTNNFVDAVADIFKTEADFKLCITPEGTRTRVTKLKTGFYYIALKANVPLVLGKFDWGKKEIAFSDAFYPTGDFDADLIEISKFYKNTTGKIKGWGYFDN